MDEYLFNRNSIWRQWVFWSRNMCFYALLWIFRVLLNVEFTGRKKKKSMNSSL